MNRSIISILLLAGGASGNVVSEIIFNLRKKYPKVANAEILNYLTTAYCPIVAAQGRLLDQAVTKIRNFDKIVFKIFHNRKIS